MGDGLIQGSLQQPEPLSGFEQGTGGTRCAFLTSVYSYLFNFQSIVLERASGTRVASYI